MSIWEEYFDDRKPSVNQVMQSIKRGLKQGHTEFEVSWGENMVSLQKNLNGTWFGHGWIRSISGDDLAKHFEQGGF